MDINWKFLKNNSEVYEAIIFEHFYNNEYVFPAQFESIGNFIAMPQQFYSYNNIDPEKQLMPIVKIVFNDLEMYIGGGIGSGIGSGIGGSIGGRWCNAQVEFLIHIPHWQITYMACIGEDCRHSYNIHYSSFCEEQADVIDSMNFRDKLLAYYNWGIKSYIPVNLCDNSTFRRSRGCGNCGDCIEWQNSSTIYDLPKLNDVLNPYEGNNIPLAYKIQIIDENITPSLETINNWKLFLQNERKELLTFVAPIGTKRAENKIALLFRTANNSRQDWLRHVSGF